MKRKNTNNNDLNIIKKIKFDTIKPIYRKKQSFNTIDNIKINDIIKNYKHKIISFEEFLTVINYETKFNNKLLNLIIKNDMILLDDYIMMILSIKTKKEIINYISKIHEKDIDYILTNKNKYINNMKSINKYNKNINIYVNKYCLISICNFINIDNTNILKKNIYELEKLYKLYNNYKNHYKDIKLENTKLIKNLQINKQLHKFNEYIYIITTKQKAKENIFKIGRTRNLKTRLSTYNTGSIKSDEYFYCSYYSCTSASSLENRIFDILKNFRISKELYQLHFTIIDNIVKMICNNDNTICKNINNFIETEYDDYIFEIPIEF